MIGSIEWRGKNKDHARLIVSQGLDNKGKEIRARKSVGKISKKQAALALAEFVLELQKAQEIVANNLSFQEFTDIWFRDYGDANLAPKTKSRYKQLIKVHIAPEFGAMKLSKIRPHHLLQFYTKLRNIKSPVAAGQRLLSEQTLLHHHRLLNRIFTHAVEWLILGTNPVSKVPTPRVGKKEMRVFEPADVAKVYELLHHETESLRALVVTALNTGMRSEELAGLRWKNVDFKNGIITVCETRQSVDGVGEVVGGTKTGKSRRIPLSARAKEVLAEYQANQTARREAYGSKWVDRGYVFVHDNGQPIFPKTPSQWFTKFVSRHALPKLTLHGLRHTFATQLIGDGVPLAVVSEILGHSQRSTTLNIYTHPSDTGYEMALQSMNKELHPLIPIILNPPENDDETD